jgi:hypothetical protein
VRRLVESQPVERDDLSPGHLDGEAATHQEALCGRGAGLRAASTLRLPHFRHQLCKTRIPFGSPELFADATTLPEMLEELRGKGYVADVELGFKMT